MKFLILLLIPFTAIAYDSDDSDVWLQLEYQQRKANETLKRIEQQQQQIRVQQQIDEVNRLNQQYREQSRDRW